jgi:hypothetical protein
MAKAQLRSVVNTAPPLLLLIVAVPIASPAPLASILCMVTVRSAALAVPAKPSASKPPRIQPRIPLFLRGYRAAPRR